MQTSPRARKCPISSGRSLGERTAICLPRPGSGGSSCFPRSSTPTTRRSPGPESSGGGSSPRSTRPTSKPCTVTTRRSRLRRRSHMRTADTRRCSTACRFGITDPEADVVDWPFLWLLVSNGILIWSMYALIALGFVLVYKATDAINFAQGDFVMIAGFLVASAVGGYRSPLWAAVAAALAAMVAFGFGLERVVLRPLLGRPVVAVIMATIGLSAILRGLGPLLWGAETKAVPLPIPDEPLILGPLFLPPIQLLGAAVSLVFLAAFGWFFLHSRQGIAMRAVADSQPVAMAMGINVERYFAVAWAMAGVVSALGGVVWGNLLGADVHLALVGFKVFPVVILGGL